MVRRRAAGSGADPAPAAQPRGAATSASRAERPARSGSLRRNGSDLRACGASGCCGGGAHPPLRPRRSDRRGRCGVGGGRRPAFAARALRDPELRRAADAYDRAARPPYGRVPPHTRNGDQLRATARLLALVGNISGDGTLAAAALLANLVALAVAVAELRQAQQHAAQAAAARRAAEHLHCAHTRARSRAAQPGWAVRPEHAGRATAPAAARSDFPVPLRLDQALLDDPAVASYSSPPCPYRRSIQSAPDPVHNPR